MNTLCKLLTRASEKLSEADPSTRARLRTLEGKVFHVIIHSPDINLFVVSTPQGLIFQPDSDCDADVTLSGSFVAFAGYGLGGLGLNLDSKEPVSIQGDLELAQTFQRILAKVDVDREELLASIIGDTPARKLNVFMTSFIQMFGDSARLAQTNLCEYLQEEKQILISQAAMRRHVHEVDSLRSRLDRAELRVSILKQNEAFNPS
ncbi:MAG: SCP2 sterol-binding domain-containing protein [Gammaproteobacteria bacterium]|nr:SCP2 sterol-binding domain-containing protein [Gammaproteobacteria bacterium]MCY4219846.1 SCP2 sterol-binding domain-containing protein [Gammaproteobacteria bacterium]MCY4275165.1 SCP2 sterol-binding domain-containing protein [Gammaproteobacteria bacterium]